MFTIILPLYNNSDSMSYSSTFDSLTWIRYQNLTAHVTPRRAYAAVILEIFPQPARRLARVKMTGSKALDLM